MGDSRNVIVELTSTAVPRPAVMGIEAGLGIALEAAVPADLPGITLDRKFAAVPLPKLIPEKVEAFEANVAFALDPSPEASTYLVRGTLDESDITETGYLKKRPPNVVGVYSDPRIEVCLICPGSPPLGTDTDVANLLDVVGLNRRHMDGHGVMLAIVDTGINLEYLRGHGKNPHFNLAKSWVPEPGLTPGDLPVNHGTMCAYDALIAAPKATLLDIAVLLSNRTGGSIMDGLLSDAVRAYSHLLRIMLAPKRPGEARSMVVSNSWGSFHPSWDFPVGHPGNYSHNLLHPFSRIVASLARAGADILFAAGNCGRECPDYRCQGVTNGGIYGANSHPQVLTIAGVDTTKNRVGYSTSGPGCLEKMKPDLSSYTHFTGSGVYAADGGTSAATPVAAGAVAALRSRFPYVASVPATHPSAIRTLLTHTAEDRGAVGFDFDYGWGIINGHRVARLRRLTTLEPVPAEPIVPEEPISIPSPIVEEVPTIPLPEEEPAKAA